MKRLLLAALSAAFTLSMGMPAQAQDDGPQFRPLEIWACTFRDRKDQDDMDDVYAMFSDTSVGYAAFQLNPYFVGGLRENFDFIYLGSVASDRDRIGDL